MPGFVYRVIDSDGRERKGNMNAPSKEQVQNRLIAEGLIIVDVDIDDILDSESLFGRGKINFCSLAYLCRQMSYMLKAGISAVHALTMMAEQLSDKYFRNVVNFMIDQIHEGTTFAEAARNADVFPEEFLTVVETSEKAGALYGGMNSLAEYYEREAKRDKLKKRALWYPVSLIVLTVLIVIGALIFVVPGFMGMFVDMQINMPRLSRIVSAIGVFLSEKWWILLIAVAVIAACVTAFLRSRTGMIFASRFRINYPGMYKRKMIEDCAAFSGQMALMLGAGVSLAKALEVTSSAFSHHVIMRKAIVKARNQVVTGGSLSKQLEAAGFFPRMLINMISVGEETGDIKGMFETAADYYEEESMNALHKYISTVEPVMILILAVLIGLVIMSLITPLLRLYETVGNM